jgi:hypothetical protein
MAWHHVRSTEKMNAITEPLFLRVLCSAITDFRRTDSITDGIVEPLLFLLCTDGTPTSFPNGH